MDETGLFYCLEPDATLATGPVKEKKIKNEFRSHFGQMQPERINRSLFCSQEQRYLVVLEKTLVQIFTPSTVTTKRPG